MRPAIGLLAALFLVGCGHDHTEHPYQIRSVEGVADPQFGRTVGNLLGPPLVTGNSIQTLVNGDRIFPAMLEAIRSAKTSVQLETFVYWKGRVGAEFTEALAERAAHGVQVNVIIDSYGSGRIDHAYIKRMKDAGAYVVEYHPLKWYDLPFEKKYNNRTHRKLLIVDGRIGFTGGVGIADEWLGDAQDKKHWRDNHYLIRGPAVGQLQAAFLDNWMETTGQVLEGDAFFPPQEDAGNQAAQMFKSSPGGGGESMELLYLMSIAAAKKNIRLCTAYFIPDHATIEQLTLARQRGVSVQIIAPGRHIDEKLVRPASRARWGDMLKSGVEIYEYEPTMYHTKLMVVDDRWVSIGSANLDDRSFRLNDEANLNVMDEKFAAEQIRLFEMDLGKSKRITEEEWKKRPWVEKLVEGLSTVFGFEM